MLIKEKVKPLQPFRVDNGNIHGHVCIDLHNTKSGSTERIEGDNLVTNAAQDILNLAAIGYTTPPYNLLPLATNLLGGLFIFDGTLQENVNNVEFPGSQAKFVGSAGDRVDTSINTLGIRNNEESMSIQGGYKTVWDFSTNCCNGTIRSLARTSLNNGNYLKDYTNLFSSGEFYADKPDGRIFMKDNKIYVSYINKIYKSPLQGERVYNDFNNRLTDTLETWDSSNMISNLSSDVTDNIRFGYVASSGNFLHQHKFYTYNISTGQSVEYTFPNEITTSTYASGPVKLGDYIYVTSNNNIYKISLNNTSNYSILDYHYSSYYGLLQPMGKAIKGGYENESYIIYDDDTVIPLDNSNRFLSNRGALTTFHNKPYFFNGQAGDSYNWVCHGYFKILINEFLGTIFNLPEAITKTANQTMKITYTLTNV